MLGALPLVATALAGCIGPLPCAVLSMFWGVDGVAACGDAPALGAPGSLPPKSIATVRGGAFFAAAASCEGTCDGTIGSPGVGSRWGAPGMSCVPGFFGRAGGGGGATEGRSFSMAFPMTCWNASRCEIALLTARGETCEGCAPSTSGGFDADLFVSSSTRSRGEADRLGGAVAANGSGVLGDAVTANGLTEAFGATPAGTLTTLTFDDGLAGAAAETFALGR